METAERPHNLGRRLRTIGVVAGLAAGGLGAVSPAAYAQATSTPHLRTGSYGPAFAARASTAGVTPSATGATAVNSADYPGVVGIQTYTAMFFGDQGGIFAGWNVNTCTGTVISPTKVATTASCVDNLMMGTTYVIAGRNTLSDQTSGYVAAVATTWTDPNYGSRFRPNQDVAVLTLKEPLPAVYLPIQMSAQGDQAPYAVGTSADRVGYGMTDPATGRAGVLQKVAMAVKDDAVCAGVTGYDATTMTCAGPPDGSTTPAGYTLGEPLLVATAGGTVQSGILDWGAGNNNYVFERLSYYNSEITQDVARHGLVNLDWTGDGHSDLFTRDASGYLKVYSGSGIVGSESNGFVGSAYPDTTSGGWTQQVSSGGWNIYNKLFRVTDWNGDDTESVMGRDAYGRLWQYQSNGAGGFVGDRVQVGSGWSMFSDIMVTNNWTGDGHPNILGRTPGGALYLYTSDGNGGWEHGGYGQLIGTGWNMFNTVLTPGDWKGDGHQALIGRTSTGDLRLYESAGASGGWVDGNGVVIGTGWNMFKVFMSPGDWNGDDTVDLIGITPSGEMYLYTTDGKGNWITGVGQDIDSGWNVFNAIY